MILFIDKIKDLLKPGMVTSMTRLALVNAIYFKGNWLNRFAKSETKEMDFKLNQVRKTMQLNRLGNTECSYSIQK